MATAGTTHRQLLHGKAGNDLDLDAFNLPTDWSQLLFGDWQIFPNHDCDNARIWQQQSIVPEDELLDWTSGTIEYQNDSFLQSHPTDGPGASLVTPPKSSDEPSPRCQHQTQPAGTKRKKPRRKVKQPSNDRVASKTTRRSSGLDDTTPEYGEKNHNNARTNSPNGDNSHENQSGQSHRRLRERNRVAANRFRVRKREHNAKLEIKKQEMEQQHHQLCHCVKELTQEVYQLKMQLLQHSECNCIMIQDYIGGEAQRYIHSMEPAPEPHSPPGVRDLSNGIARGMGG